LDRRARVVPVFRLRLANGTTLLRRLIRGATYAPTRSMAVAISERSSIVSLIHSDGEFEKALGRLNALTGGLFRWGETEARKQHKDLFGDVIRLRDIYFKRQYGAAYDSIVRLSRSSMDKVLFAVLTCSEQLTQLGDRLLEQEHEQMREVMEREAPKATAPRR
jgi:hypothetical protein